MTKKIITYTKDFDSLKCSHCDYVWKPRVKEPKECPNCKRVFGIRLSELARAEIKDTLRHASKKRLC